jgi:putative acetyltransferase
MTVQIRRETADDIPAIHDVNRRAFETASEADLVDALRRQADPFVSLVALVDGKVAGHILFSPVTLSSRPGLRLMGLAPMAVAPDRQRQGIGSALVRAGLEECRRLAADGVVVLGHAAFYPRFGFVPASRFSLTCEYDVPDDVFMAMELRSGALTDSAGVIRYHPAFAQA